MRTAIVSDVHSNLEAFLAVWSDIGLQNVDRVIFLGDVVGYGPNPKECIDHIVLERDQYNVRLVKGNHDVAVYTGDVIDMKNMAKNAAIWTRDQLTGDPAYMDFLAKMESAFTEGDVKYAHASPEEGYEIWKYLFHGDAKVGLDFSVQSKSEPVGSAFVDMRKRGIRIAFGGHTHRPGIIVAQDSGPGIQITDLKTQGEIHGVYDLSPFLRYIINVGSVGQPRDKDKRASYVIFDDGGSVNRSVQFRRVSYNYRATMAKIGKIKELDNGLGVRLAIGL